MRIFEIFGVEREYVGSNLIARDTQTASHRPETVALDPGGGKPFLQHGLWRTGVLVTPTLAYRRNRRVGQKRGDHMTETVSNQLVQTRQVAAHGSTCLLPGDTTTVHVGEPGNAGETVSK